MRSIVCLLATVWLSAVTVAQGEIQVHFAMDSDPLLKAPEPLVFFPAKNVPLWLTALARPEADLQRRAAEAIAEAHLLGCSDLDDAKPILVQIVAAEKTNSAARLAAARTLVVLEAKESADTLFAASKNFGTELRQVIEPALAKWKFQPIRPLWQQRLKISDTRHRDLMLAIDGVQAASDGSAVPALLLIVHDQQRPIATRLAAARAAGQIQTTGLEPEVEQLLKPAAPPLVSRLCAVALLKQHHSQAALNLLLRLAQDDEPTIAAEALAALNSSEPKLVLSIGEQVLLNQDANVRLQGIATYVTLATPSRVARLGRLLDDPHRGVRNQIREQLFVLAENAELKASILQSATEVLAGPSWRGHEQAVLLLAALDHKPAAARIAQLLDSPRAEVMVTAAWGLRVLAVQDTLPAIQKKVQREFDLRIKSAVSSLAADAQVGHLCEALGLMKHTPAEPLLQRFIPKLLNLGEFSRSGAIWALGHLHAGVPDEPLGQLLVGRLTESTMLLPAEMPRVRVASAISLGRMQSKSQTERIRGYLGSTGSHDPVSLAIRWAIHEITGETFPPLERPKMSAKSNWFLQPLD